MSIQRPRGTRDIFGPNAKAWQWLESHIRHVCDLYGFGEIRIPIFEHTELFLRGVGETTDVVQKEMYTFDDKGGRSITLRPELTAGVARAFIQHGMHSTPMPAKFFYTGPVFRYEAPQHGRLRQHHQFGVESYGSAEPSVEAEVIAVGHSLLERLGVKGVTVYINSLGCSVCHGEYRGRLKDYVGGNLKKMCEDCRRRFEKNPLRALDCKVDTCKKVMDKAPSVIDTLDEECLAHFQTLQELLKGMGIAYEVNPKIVRGLDYYNRTVFEFMAEGLPTVIGGGRYDGLVEKVLGDPNDNAEKILVDSNDNDKSTVKTPSVGFGMGMDRLLMLLDTQNLLPDSLANAPQIYIGHMGDAGYQKSQILVHELRRLDISAESDLLKRSVKAQMKYADKIQAAYSLIIGGNEIEVGTAKLKNMGSGEQIDITLDAKELEKEILKWAKA